jgi:hypothetical protein
MVRGGGGECYQKTIAIYTVSIILLHECLSFIFFHPHYCALTTPRRFGHFFLCSDFRGKKSLWYKTVKGLSFFLVPEIRFFRIHFLFVEPFKFFVSPFGEQLYILSPFVLYVRHTCHQTSLKYLLSDKSIRRTNQSSFFSPVSCHSTITESQVAHLIPRPQIPVEYPNQGQPSFITPRTVQALSFPFFPEHINQSYPSNGKMTLSNYGCYHRIFFYFFMFYSDNKQLTMGVFPSLH